MPYPGQPRSDVGKGAPRARASPAASSEHISRAATHAQPPMRGSHGPASRRQLGTPYGRHGELENVLFGSRIAGIQPAGFKAREAGLSEEPRCAAGCRAPQAIERVAGPPPSTPRHERAGHGSPKRRRECSGAGAAILGRRASHAAAVEVAPVIDEVRDLVELSKPPLCKGRPVPCTCGDALEEGAWAGPVALSRRA